MSNRRRKSAGDGTGNDPATPGRNQGTGPPQGSKSNEPVGERLNLVGLSNIGSFLIALLTPLILLLVFIVRVELKTSLFEKELDTLKNDSRLGQAFADKLQVLREDHESLKRSREEDVFRLNLEIKNLKAQICDYQKGDFDYGTLSCKKINDKR